VNIVQSTRAVLESTKNLEAAAVHIIQAIALKDDLLAASSGEQFARRWGNVEAMLNMLRRRDSKGPNEISALQEYIRFLSLNIDSTDEEAQDVVTLQTMHGSKGLEYRLVLVAGLEEGIMPHTRSLNPKATDMMPQDVEEERRLFYVCVTRARDRLILHRTKLRGTPEKPIPRVPSRFLLDVPSELILEREVTQKVAPTTESLAKGAEGLLAALGVMGAPGASARPSAAARPGPTRPYSAASSGAPVPAAPSITRPSVERPAPRPAARPAPRPAAPKQPIPKTGWWSR
jgi:DNA helicase-2/ATP-dependent DNA helicase PcrA